MLAILLQASGYVLSPAVLRVAPAPQPSATSHVNVAMNWFAGAFANDDSLGARENAGLSKEKAKKTITWVGPNGQSKKSVVVPGQKLRDVARSTGIKIKYDCNEGTCKTCEAMIDGRKAKICVSKAPAKDVTIKYK